MRKCGLWAGCAVGGCGEWAGGQGSKMAYVQGSRGSAPGIGNCRTRSSSGNGEVAVLPILALGRRWLWGRPTGVGDTTCAMLTCDL